MSIFSCRLNSGKMSSKIINSFLEKIKSNDFRTPIITTSCHKD